MTLYFPTLFSRSDVLAWTGARGIGVARLRLRLADSGLVWEVGV